MLEAINNEIYPGMTHASWWRMRSQEPQLRKESFSTMQQGRKNLAIKCHLNIH